MSNKGEYTKLQERGEGGKRTKEQKENDEEIQEQEKGFMADGFCEHLAHDQQVRYLSIVAVQFGFAFASLVSGFQLNFLCTTFAVGFFVFKTFTSHSKNVIGWWRRLMKAIKNKAEFKEIAFEVVQAPLFVFGDILDVKLDIINAYRMIGFYTNFTITMASFFATASQTSIAAALPCLVAFDFLRDIFKREVEHSTMSEEEMIENGKKMNEGRKHYLGNLMYYAFPGYAIILVVWLFGTSV